jgi:hypothetical protein
VTPVLSCSVKKASFPNTRRAMMRPANATSAASSSDPGSRAAHLWVIVVTQR